MLKNEFETCKKNQNKNGQGVSAQNRGAGAQIDRTGGPIVTGSSVAKKC